MQLLSRDAPSGGGESIKTRGGWGGGEEEHPLRCTVIVVFAAERRHAIRRFKPTDEGSTLADSRYFARGDAQGRRYLTMTLVPRLNCESLLGNAFAIRDCRREQRKREGIFPDRGSRTMSI